MHVSDLGSVATAVLALVTVVGLAARSVKKAGERRDEHTRELIRREVVAPMRDVHRQVTVNEHKSDEPTVLDRLEDVVVEQKEQRQEIAAVASALGKHLRDAKVATDRVHRSIDELSQQLAAQLNGDEPE